MCTSRPEKPDPPPIPPAPPPVLEQDAPKTSQPKTGQKLAGQASGTKKYRNPLGISNEGAGAANTNLGIAQ